MDRLTPAARRQAVKLARQAASTVTGIPVKDMGRGKHPVANGANGRKALAKAQAKRKAKATK